MRDNTRKVAGQSSAMYGIAFVGALIYYLRHTTGFWAGLLGFVKALFWPGVLIYHLMEYLKM